MDNFKAGKQILRTDYSSFEPKLVNHQWVFSSPKVMESLSRADRSIGRLDMFSEYIPDLDMFIRMHVYKEAIKSSRIEDTKTEMEEALLPQEEVALEKRDDWTEVNNYVLALNQSVQNLEKIPFSNRILCDAHQTLMTGVRGERKTPGEYRRSQNWIGGSSPSNARFVPPHQDGLPELMGDMELFGHNQELHIPPLLKIAIMHYQFETIHPFLDGNGRIGRLMIPLYLIHSEILKKPVLYISDFLEKNRDEYYQRLTDVREKNDLEGWLIFMLDGVSETAEKGVKTFNQILQFKKFWQNEITNWKKQSGYGLLLLESLYSSPVVTAGQIAKITNVSNPTAYKILEKFVKCGLLKEKTQAKRNKLYLCAPYLDLFK